MNRRARVLVTGASGNVGGAALQALVDQRLADVDVVAAVTRLPAAQPAAPAAAPGSSQPATRVRLDFFDAATFAPALDGVTRVVLVRPPAIGDVKHTLIPFVDACWGAGVEHIVFLSVVGADQNPILPHTKVEQHLARHGHATFLRAGFFAQNLTDTWRADVVDDQRLFLPAKDGRVAFVDARDLGAAAAVLALGPVPDGCVALDLTGGEALSLDDVAALVASATGRPVRYVRCSALAFFTHLWRRRRMPLLQAVILTALHVGLRKNDVAHGAARVTTTLGEVLGRPPRTMAAFVDEHRRALGATT